MAMETLDPFNNLYSNKIVKTTFALKLFIIIHIYTLFIQIC